MSWELAELWFPRVLEAAGIRLKQEEGVKLVKWIKEGGFSLEYLSREGFLSEVAEHMDLKRVPKDALREAVNEAIKHLPSQSPPPSRLNLRDNAGRHLPADEADYERSRSPSARASGPREPDPALSSSQFP